MAMMDNLKRLRKERGITQEQLAVILDVDRSTIAQWETGLSFPRMSKAIDIIKYFNITIDELIADDSTKRLLENLTDSERELLDIYRSLSPANRETAIRLLSALAPSAGDKGQMESA